MTGEGIAAEEIARPWRGDSLPVFGTSGVWRKAGNERRGQPGPARYNILRFEETAMVTQVDAILINGVLKPDVALPLADQTRVRLTVEPIIDAAAPTGTWELLQAWIRDNPVHGLGRHLTRDELHERH